MSGTKLLNDCYWGTVYECEGPGVRLWRNRPLPGVRRPKLPEGKRLFVDADLAWRGLELVSRHEDH